MTIYSILINPYVHGALLGWVTAAAIDWQAFKAWKSYQDFYNYTWSTATWRWLQGAVIGAVGAVILP